MSETTVKPEDRIRKDWLAQRRRLIGASDVAAILGADSRRGPLAVYAEKVGHVEAEDTPSMRWGRRAEALVADIYGEASGRPVLPPAARIIQHPEVRWLGASLDRVTGGSKEFPAPVETLTRMGGTAPLECKVVGIHKAEDWKDEPPLEYVIQVQAQMACTGAQWASLAALFGWPPRPVWVDIPRNDRFINLALPRLEEFWMRVERRDPPPSDAKPGTTDAIRALWPADTGEVIHLPADTLDLVVRWEAAKARRSELKKTSEDQVDELENRLRVLMKDATTGMLPDGSSLTLKTTPAAPISYVRDPYRTLRRFWPKGLRRTKA
jgi:putative phage-type endonuclease